MKWYEIGPYSVTSTYHLVSKQETLSAILATKGQIIYRFYAFMYSSIHLFSFIFTSVFTQLIDSIIHLFSF